MSLGARLRDLRVRKNLSLQDVADAVNASKAHIWNLEKGTSDNPSMELLVGLATLFKVGVADLVGEDPSSAKEDPEMVALYRNLKQLDGRDLETIRVLTEQLKKARKASD
ncbi:MAG: helix-turn-helix domain-containing protein [Sphingomonadaceae bacterium]